MNAELWHMGSSSLTRDRPQASSTGSVESQPLDHQGRPTLRPSGDKPCRTRARGDETLHVCGVRMRAEGASRPRPLLLARSTLLSEPETCSFPAPSFPSTFQLVIH